MPRPRVDAPIATITKSGIIIAPHVVLTMPAPMNISPIMSKDAPAIISPFAVTIKSNIPMHYKND